jgi:hypothetical protein
MFTSEKLVVALDGVGVVRDAERTAALVPKVPEDVVVHQFLAEPLRHVSLTACSPVERAAIMTIGTARQQ